MEFIVDVLIGVVISAFLVDLVINPLFARFEWKRLERLESRIKVNKNRLRMTNRRAEELLGIK